MYALASEVIAHAINTAAMSRHGKILYVMELKPLHVEPERIHAVIGALVSQDDHFIALRSVAGQIWCLNSLQQHPSKMTFDQYKACINKYKEAYPIRHADNMRDEAQPSASSAAGDSPLLPLASQASLDVFADSPATLNNSGAVPMFAEETNVPSLMIAESFGADEAMEVNQNSHMERGLELEAMALDARSDYESALAERGGR